MEDRRAVLKELDMYEGQLALGVYSAEMTVISDAFDDLNGVLDILTSFTETMYPVIERNAADLLPEFKQAIVNARETRDDNGPLYEVAKFAKTNLVFRAPDGGELTETEVENNRRKLGDYRRQLESSGV